MGLISPGGQNLLNFLELWQVLSTYDGDPGTRSRGLRKVQSPWELLGGLSGFLSRRCRGLRPCVESGPEPEDSSPVLTRNFGFYWSLHRGVSPRLEMGHAQSLSSRAVAAVSCFLSRESRYLWLSLEAFPRICFPYTASSLTQRIYSHHNGTRNSPVGKHLGKASWESLEKKPQIP